MFIGETRDLNGNPFIGRKHLMALVEDCDNQLAAVALPDKMLVGRAANLNSVQCR
ncbi:hypothetical protein [Burkholderia sp. NLJ2]|uniref:hypothetical protein n=1 Tax=Burkholderia sp. NLJ2 TaxID=3090699 RepID=UPI003C6C3C85